MSNSILPMYSSRSPVVSSLTFRSLILSWLLNREWGNILISLFYMYLSSSPRTYWRDSLFSTVYSCLLDCRLMTIGAWVYFWTLYSVPSIYVSVFVPVPCCFDYCGFVSTVWSLKGQYHQLHSFLSRLLQQFRVFYGSI